ncbi:MAG TPA: hypothetical protein VF659_12455 [Pyrinomonadaceae bacterium]|jgi:hypothetical protein
MRLRIFLLASGLTLAFAARASAHDGPPYAILVDKSLGPCTASIWADPDVGTGTFYIILEPPPGDELPEDIRVQVGVRPADGRAAEAVYAAERDGARGRVQYTAEVPFDAEGPWRVRVMLQSRRGGGELFADIEVTPPGLGRWDLLLYLTPFLAVGFLWLRAVAAKRRGGGGGAMRKTDSR